MAFIREYAMEGDPFSLRRPKWLRKLKVGRALGKVGKGLLRVAAPVASFIPGVGGIASKLMGIASKFGVSPSLATEFARSYGIDLGDPEDEEGQGMSGYMNDEPELDFYGDPGAPRPARKRKNAGSGPRAKAQKKREKRRERARRRGGAASFGSKLGSSLATGARAVGGALPGLFEAIKAGGPQAAAAYMASHGAGGSPEDAALAEMAAAMGGAKPGRSGGMRFGGKRRAMNPTNVRALKRSIRRVEGFNSVVKRIQKAYPALRGPGTARAASPRRARGHRSGCGCVVCKRAA